MIGWRGRRQCPQEENWWDYLERWLEPFLVGLSHPARRRMCPLSIAGLIGQGTGKVFSRWRPALSTSAMTSFIISLPLGRGTALR